MPAMAPPERLEEEDVVVAEEDCAAAGEDVEDAVVEAAVDVGDVVLAVVEATWATPKAKPSYG
jgi:hypothetical protein